MPIFQELGFYLLRSPKISINEIEKFLCSSEKETPDIIYRHLFNQKHLKDAIFLSSLPLYNELERWLSGKSHITDKLMKPLYKYYIRSGMRCTPFGNLAGISYGKISYMASENFKIVRSKNDIMKFRLDMEKVENIILNVSKDPNIKVELKFSLNNTIYKQGEYFKFYYHQNSPNSREFLLKKIKCTPVLNYIINVNKKLTYKEWSALIQSQGAKPEQAVKLLDVLIDNQILNSEMQALTIGQDSLVSLIERLKTVDLRKKHFPALIETQKILNSKSSIEEKSNSIKDNLEINDSQNSGLHVDLKIGTKFNEIKTTEIRKLLNQLEELLFLSQESQSSELKKFKQNFLKRYEGQMIPLLDALDPDTGIGYGSLSNSMDIWFQETDNKKAENKNKHENLLEQIVYNRYLLRSKIKPLSEVAILAEDIHELSKKIKNNYPIPTIYAIGNILVEKNKKNSLIFNLQAYGGSSSANLISRFSYLDNSLEKCLKEIGELEQNSSPDAILAEIVYLPEFSNGNIHNRPKMRNAEIGIIVKSENGTLSISINQLFIFIQNNRIILWSKDLNKEIIPKLTNAHNYKRGNNLYRFLSDLQTQENLSNVTWRWEKFANLPYLPRIRFKNIILQRAKWFISQISDKSRTLSQKKEEFDQIIITYNIPNLVVLAEGDNELFLDLSKKICADIFFDKLQKKDITLFEFIFSDYQSPVIDENGLVYCNEVVLPIKVNKVQKLKATPPNPTIIKRFFPLGGEWLYVKFYCGIYSADNLLNGSISDLIKILKTQNLIKKWFFVRYNDPDHHLRIRFEINSSDGFYKIVEFINQYFTPKLKENDISNIQYDTYIREIERYTSQYIEDSEELFHIESEFILSITKEITQTDKLLLCLKYIDGLLSYGCISNNNKLLFSKKMKSIFALEFDKKEKDWYLDKLFREKKPLIEFYLRINIINEKMQKSFEQFEKISNKIELEEISTSDILEKKHFLLSSYIHMFINRFFFTDQRRYEYVSYYILTNYYLMNLKKNNN